MPRRAKPSALRVLEGNREHRRLHHDPQPAIPAELPPAPDGFDAIERAEWDRTAAVLHPIGLLTLADLPVLAAYCQQFAIWERSSAELRAGKLNVVGSTGSEIQNPLVRTNNAAAMAMLRYLTELGMTPAARSKIDARPKANDNPMARLFGGG